MNYLQNYLQNHQLSDFESVSRHVQNLPYKRNKDKSDIFCILRDNGGTCSTKHAFLKWFADQNNIENVQLMMGIFSMNSENTKKIAPVLQKYGLKEIPEAHNYLKINTQIFDFTRKNTKPEDFLPFLITETEINIHQITNFKIQYHQDFLKKYLHNHPEIPYSIEEFWKIREECIAALQS